MDIAFDDSEQKAISTSFLRNDDNTQLGSEAYYEDVIDTNDTEDKIYLLSLTELYKELGTRNFLIYDLYSCEKLLPNFFKLLNMFIPII